MRSGPDLLGITPFDPALVEEARRQLTICNACRYCEGYCAVFPASERRSLLTEGDIASIANVCHDCRACYQACMYTPPHEFAVNIPQLLSEVRVQSYRRYAWPARFASLFKHTTVVAALAGLVGLMAVLTVVVSSGGSARFFTADNGAGSFYRVIPFVAMVVPSMALSLWIAAVFAGGALSFWKDSARPARQLLSPSAWWHALAEGLTLRWMGGGDDGCYYPSSKTTSGTRRLLHSFVFYGFLADFAATGLATVWQHFLEQLPPYPLTSAPVLLGAAGGIAMIVGCTGLLAQKVRADRYLIAREMIQMDTGFLALLNLASITGMALLALRGTPLMATMLAIHFAVLAGLYVTAPYGKFVHFVYRLLALVRNQLELAEERPGGR